MKTGYFVTFALALSSTANAFSRLNDLPGTMADCAVDCPDTSVATGSSYFAALEYSTTNCAAVIGICNTVNNAPQPFSNILTVTDHDGTQASEKYSVDVSQSGLPQIVINTIAAGPAQQSQNSIISGTMTPILLANGRNLGVYNTESPAVNAANFAKLNNNCESAAFASSWQKFFECMGPRTTGMPTDVLMDIRYAAFESFPLLGQYYSFQVSAEQYLYDLGIKSIVQSGGTAWEYTAQATIYPQPYNAVIRSDACNPTLRSSDEMLAQSADGCPFISDSVKTTPSIVSQVPNTVPICGVEAFDAADTCVSDSAGKGLNLQFNCEEHDLCNTFFFGNSGGDLYPANYTLYLKTTKILTDTAVFIHNNPSICQQLRVTYNESFNGNVPCYDIAEPANEFAFSFSITPANITAFLASYDKFRAQRSGSSDNNAAENFLANSKWAFLMYGFLGLAALQVLVYAADRKTGCLEVVKRNLNHCVATLFSTCGYKQVEQNDDNDVEQGLVDGKKKSSICCWK